MCGIAGIWNGANAAEHQETIATMVSVLKTRGPDGSGTWSGAPHEPTFGHARLAILDVSERGAQPMQSPSGRYTLTYNGEVYNHHALRAELRNRSYVGDSDTESLLAGFEEWGIEQTIKRCVGMFAMGIWDAHDRILHLVRDRLGVKPLYVGRDAKGIVFASDLAAITRSGLQCAIDSTAVAEFLRYAYVPRHLSIYQGVAKVPPATLMSFSATDKQPYSSTYWRADDSGPLLTGLEALRAVDETLEDAVAQRLLSDVPLGVFLSGGIDSSLVTALAQKASSSPIKTFSIGFDAAGYDESSYAAQVANHLGTDHHELRITAKVAQDAVTRLAGVYSEPFADSSQLPTLLLCEFARQNVTVALSGDGGDEVFGGYNRHVFGPKLAGVLRTLPAPAKGPAAAVLRRASQSPVFELLTPLLAHVISLPKEKLEKVARLLTATSDGDLYEAMTHCWADIEPIVQTPPAPSVSRPGSFTGESTRRWDLNGYLPDDILVKVDRASMAVSLEARVPLLDHRVVELGFRIPHEEHVAGNTGKVLLRTLLSRHVPRHFFERPKAGFAVPLAGWLRGSLRDWASSLLTKGKLEDVGLRPEPVTQAWREFLGGAATHHRIWAVLMLSAWNQRWR